MFFVLVFYVSQFLMLQHFKDLQEKLQMYETKAVISKESAEHRLLQISNLRSNANMDHVYVHAIIFLIKAKFFIK